MSNKNAPWNKGLTGLAAGWDEARRKRASKAQRKRIKQRPKKYQALLRKGPRPKDWVTGPDKEVHKHYYRFLRAKAQAKFWSQAWPLKWDDYLDMFKTMIGKWGRKMQDINIARIDTTQGWHIWNVQLMTRTEAMSRLTRGKNRIKPKGSGSKSKGIVWQRRKNYERSRERKRAK